MGPTKWKCNAMTERTDLGFEGNFNKEEKMRQLVSI